MYCWRGAVWGWLVNVRVQGLGGGGFWLEARYRNRVRGAAGWVPVKYEEPEGRDRGTDPVSKCTSAWGSGVNSVRPRVVWEQRHSVSVNQPASIEDTEV